MTGHLSLKLMTFTHLYLSVEKSDGSNRIGGAAFCFPMYTSFFLSRGNLCTRADILLKVWFFLHHPSDACGLPYRLYEVLG